MKKMLHLILVCCVNGVLLTAQRTDAQESYYRFTTLAGLAGGSGSADGTGSKARFYSPSGVAVDSTSNVYVGDRGNHTIRKITPGGVVSTLAGLAGSNGSADGTGSAARFFLPSGVAVDSSGNVYVADSGNNTIRKGVPALTPVPAGQPQNQTAMADATAVMSVGGAGTAPSTYQWPKNGVGLASARRLSGVNSTALTKASAQTADSASYAATVSNSLGAMASSSVRLPVNPPSEMKLSIRLNGQEIVLSWSDPAAVLEEADSVSGPWKLVVGDSSSPRVLAITAKQKFYRLRR